MRPSAAAAAAGTAAPAPTRGGALCALRRRRRSSSSVCRRAPAITTTTAAAAAPSSYSNLGELQRTVERAAPAAEVDPYGGVRVSAASLANRDGYAVDGGTAALNFAVLLLLLFLATERIFGLDVKIARALQAWKEARAERRRYEANDARQKLEQQWGGSDDGSGTGSNGIGGGSSGGGGQSGL